MYRQIALAEFGQKFHRTYWQDEKIQKLQTLRLTHVTYEVEQSTFHSTQCSTDIADKSSDEKNKKHIKHGFNGDYQRFGGCKYRRC